MLIIILVLVILFCVFAYLFRKESEKQEKEFKKEEKLIDEVRNKAVNIKGLHEAHLVNDLHTNLADLIKDKRHTFSYAWLGGYIQGRTHALQKEQESHKQVKDE